MNDPVNLPPPAFTPEQLAERWACEPDAIRRLCRKRKLGFFKVGSQTRIPVAAVAEYEQQGEPREQGSAEDADALPEKKTRDALVYRDGDDIRVVRSPGE